MMDKNDLTLILANTWLAAWFLRDDEPPWLFGLMFWLIYVMHLWRTRKVKK